MLSLLEDAQMEGEQLEYVEMAHASGDVLLTLINDLLDYSKIEAGQLQIEAIDFDLDRLVAEVGDLFGVRARAAGLLLETEVDVGLPGQVSGDVVRIRQVLSNLVDNALKFTSEGRVTLRVTTDGSVQEDGSCSRRSPRPTAPSPGALAARASAWRSAPSWCACSVARSTSTVRPAWAPASGSRSRCARRVEEAPHAPPGGVNRSRDCAYWWLTTAP